MPDVDVVDSTWIGVPPTVLAPLLADRAAWVRWWPELTLTLSEARGPKGVRWTAAAPASRACPALTGSMEIWLQPALDGVVAHYFLRLDRADGARLRERQRARLVRRYRARAKQVFWALSDRADPGRLGRVAEPVPGRGAAGVTR